MSELDDNLPKGKGDPDFYGYPGEGPVVVEPPDPIDLTEAPF